MVLGPGAQDPCLGPCTITLYYLVSKNVVFTSGVCKRLVGIISPIYRLCILPRAFEVWTSS